MFLCASLPRATPLADSGLALGCIIAAPLALDRMNHSTINHSALCVLQNSGLKSDLLFNPEVPSYCFLAQRSAGKTQRPTIFSSNLRHTSRTRSFRPWFVQAT